MNLVYVIISAYGMKESKSFKIPGLNDNPSSETQLKNIAKANRRLDDSTYEKIYVFDTCLLEHFSSPDAER